jgi:hypothetical protein
VTAATGRTIAYDSVRFSIYNNFDGSVTWQLRSSADGFTAVLDRQTQASNILAAASP